MPTWQSWTAYVTPPVEQGGKPIYEFLDTPTPPPDAPRGLYVTGTKGEPTGSRGWYLHIARDEWRLIAYSEAQALIARAKRDSCAIADCIASAARESGEARDATQVRSAQAGRMGELLATVQRLCDRLDRACTALEARAARAPGADDDIPF